MVRQGVLAYQSKWKKEREKKKSEEGEEKEKRSGRHFRVRVDKKRKKTWWGTQCQDFEGRKF